MRATVFLAALLLTASCGPAQGGYDTALLNLSVIDAPPTLTAGGGDYLFGLRFWAPPDSTTVPEYRVSDLHVEIVARHLQYASRWNVNYGLYLDQDGDGRFGPGDVLYVRERTRNVMGPLDSGSYQVRLMMGSHLLGTADWEAR